MTETNGKRKSGSPPSTDVSRYKVPPPEMPWDRQQDESMPAYEAFTRYRDMSYQRSVTAVAQVTHKNRTLIGGWCARHHWLARCASWDAHQEHLSRIEHEAAIRAFRHDTMRVAGGMNEAVLRTLLAWTEADQPHTLADKDIARIADTANSLAANALGLDQMGLNQRAEAELIHTRMVLNQVLEACDPSLAQRFRELLTDVATAHQQLVA